MTPQQYVKAIASLGMTQGQAADFLGISLRTSASYASGNFPVPLASAKLLRLILKLALDPKDIR